MESICCAVACTDQGATSCGTNGACNAAGTACTEYAAGTTRAPASCLDGPSSSTETSVRVCNGSGTCSAGTTTSCGAYVCGGTTCKTSCSTPSDCIAVDTCNGGICGAPVLVGNGGSCTSGGQCTSGNCEGSICCAVPCTDQGAASCGQNGSCTALGLGCALYDSTTRCSDATCTDGATSSSQTTAGHCSGTGVCDVTTTSCNGYKCDGDACLTSCIASSECWSPDACCLNGGPLNETCTLSSCPSVPLSEP